MRCLGTVQNRGGMRFGLTNVGTIELVCSPEFMSFSANLNNTEGLISGQGYGLDARNWRIYSYLLIDFSSESAHKFRCCVRVSARWCI